jgi:hypothetical protein
MVEQLKTIDYRSRNVTFVEKAPLLVIDEALSLLDACLYDPA